MINELKVFGMLVAICSYSVHLVKDFRINNCTSLSYDLSLMEQLVSKELVNCSG